MAAMAFLGLAHTFRYGEMIRVGLLIDRLPDASRHGSRSSALVDRHRLHRLLRLLRLQLIRNSWRFHDMAQGVIAVPLWIPQLGYAAGLSSC